MTTNEDFEKYLRDIFDERKERYQSNLFAAMEYAVFPSGKRIRPQMAFLSADFLGVPREKVYPLAAGIELIHGYSLIHDDMPCMDNGEERRGKPSCHRAFGEAMALLAGDALLNLAYEIMISAVTEDLELSAAVKYISEKAGAEGMVGGQALEFSVDRLDDATVTELCLKKTGALIKAALVSPCFLCYERDKTYALSVYADAVGLAFQLQDDLLDAENCEEKSYLFVNGKEKTVQTLDRLDKIAQKSMEKYPEGEELRRLSSLLNNRKI